MTQAARAATLCIARLTVRAHSRTIRPWLDPTHQHGTAKSPKRRGWRTCAKRRCGSTYTMWAARSANNRTRQPSTATSGPCGNGSPEPQFDFDTGWFRATLPAHPEYAAVSALRDAAYLRTVGSEEDAFRRVREAWCANEGSAALTTELIRQSAAHDDLDAAEEVFERFRSVAPATAVANVSNAWVEILLDHDRAEDARRILESRVHSPSARDAADAAILASRGWPMPISSRRRMCCKPTRAPCTSSPRPRCALRKMRGEHTKVLGPQRRNSCWWTRGSSWNAQYN